MKTLITLLFTLTSASVFADGPHPFDPVQPNCDPFVQNYQLPPGFSGYCCSTTANFLVAPQMTCVGGYIMSPLKPKPIKKQTYSYCCKMNNPNTGTGIPKGSVK